MNAQCQGQPRTLHQFCTLTYVVYIRMIVIPRSLPRPCHPDGKRSNFDWFAHLLLTSSWVLSFPQTPGPIWERRIEFGPQMQTFCDSLWKCCVKWASVTQRRQCRGTGVWIVARATVAVVQKSAVKPYIFQKHVKCWCFHMNDILKG